MPKNMTWGFSAPAGAALAILLAMTFGSSTVPAAQWNEASATRDYYNAQAKLRWKNKLGDWLDADGVAQGPKAFAETTVPNKTGIRPIVWDVTTLVEAWLTGKLPNNGIMLVTTAGGLSHLHSREAKEPEHRPKLLVETDDGQSFELDVTADTMLHTSTHKARGRSNPIHVARDSRALLLFDLSPLGNTGSISKALLQTYKHDRRFGESIVGVFHPDTGVPLSAGKRAKVHRGLADKHALDRGIEEHPEVVFFDGFDESDWVSSWKVDQPNVTFVPVETAESLGFAPLSGRALQVVVPKDQRMGLNLLYLFKERLGYEPEEIYFRYYLRLASDWNPTRDGGKFPGIAGTYGRAGWGGRQSDGTNGWSARGSFGVVPQGDNPLAGLTPVGNLAAHVDMPNPHGSVWWWMLDKLGLLERNRWYSIEQHVKLNSPDKKDGVLRVWIDGKLAFENRTIRYRTVDTLKIDRVWMNVYHGGKATAPVDYHLFIDNVVIAKDYIGPMANGPVSQ